MKIGVLALQGAVQEHMESLSHCNVEAITVRTREELESVDGLIIPGGESTTVGKLLERFDLMNLLRERAQKGMPVWGTCTGMILLAKDIVGSEQARIGLMDITVLRNAFGRQVDSFETTLSVEGIEGDPVHAVFIRGPLVQSVKPNVQVLAKFEDKIVMVRQGNLLASSFHPELTEDTRVHQYFADMVAGKR